MRKALRLMGLLARLYVAGAWLTALGTCLVYGTLRGRGWYDGLAALIVLGGASLVLLPLYGLARHFARAYAP